MQSNMRKDYSGLVHLGALWPLKGKTWAGISLMLQRYVWRHLVEGTLLGQGDVGMWRCRILVHEALQMFC